MSNSILMNNILKSAKRKDPNSLRIYLNQLKSIIVALNHQKNIIQLSLFYLNLRLRNILLIMITGFL